MSSNRSNLLRRSKKIQTFKSNYRALEKVLNKYLAFKARLKYENSEYFEDFKYWRRYVNEINWIFDCMDQQERKILEEKFLNKKNTKDMYISSSKYYTLMNSAVKSFLMYLDMALINHDIGMKSTKWQKPKIKEHRILAY